MAVVENNKEMVPFEHYVGLFRSLNPEEAAARCGVAFDSARGEFAIRCCTRTTRSRGGITITPD